ncbi:MAG: hypothetical protein ABIA04_14605 [Pseudomonadota bacterium]
MFFHKIKFFFIITAGLFASLLVIKYSMEVTKLFGLLKSNISSDVVDEANSNYPEKHLLDSNKEKTENAVSDLFSKKNERFQKIKNEYSEKIKIANNSQNKQMFTYTEKENRIIQSLKKENVIQKSNSQNIANYRHEPYATTKRIVNSNYNSLVKTPGASKNNFSNLYYSSTNTKNEAHENIKQHRDIRNAEAKNNPVDPEIKNNYTKFSDLAHFIPESYFKTSINDDQSENKEEDNDLDKDEEKDEENKEEEEEEEKVEALGSYEYSIEGFQAGIGLRGDNSNKDSIYNRISGPPNAPNLSVDMKILDPEIKKAKVQALGYNGELTIYVENGAIINKEGPDFIIHSIVTEASSSSSSEADVSVVTLDGELVKLGRLITGLTAKIPFDLSVTNLPAAKKIIIHDAFQMTEEVKAALEYIEEDFPGFDIDSVELINTAKDKQNTGEN